MPVPCLYLLEYVFLKIMIGYVRRKRNKHIWTKINGKKFGKLSLGQFQWQQGKGKSFGPIWLTKRINGRKNPNRWVFMSCFHLTQLLKSLEFIHSNIFFFDHHRVSRSFRITESSRRLCIFYTLYKNSTNSWHLTDHKKISFDFAFQLKNKTNHENCQCQQVKWHHV